jgi:hypothetical protein
MFYFYFFRCAKFSIDFYYPYAILNVLKSIDNLKVLPSDYLYLL